MKLKYTLIIITFSIIGIFLRLYNISFGLPHSFYADEPEVVELAVKYTFELKSIIKANDYYKLIPISFVYGTFPAYANTLATMIFSKFSNMVGINFDKTDIYIFLRSLNGMLTMIIPAVIALMHKDLFKSKVGALITFAFLSLNWKFIVHAHYVNPDATLAILLAVAFYIAYLYSNNPNKSALTVLLGVFYGLAVGSKITALISLPTFLYLFYKNKDIRGAVAFMFIIFGTFIVSNPFSLILANRFAFRIFGMFSKEGGMVFDSVNYSYLKYIQATIFISTPLVILFSLYGKFKSLTLGKNKSFHTFLILNIAIYLIFFSLQSRRVDRWMLPIIPLVIMYGAYGIEVLRSKINLAAYSLIIVILSLSYLYYPYLLTQQFKKDTPKSASYIWARDNLDPGTNKLAYTEEGLDPLNKLLGMRVIKVEVYSTENAQFMMPEDPTGYNYVFISSRPMENYKRIPVKEKYPFYYIKWRNFENTLNDETQFKLIKDFTLPKPNLIPLSDVYVYENLNPPTIGSL